MIETLQTFPPRVMAFACHGRVTRADYDSVLVPALEAALGRPGKLRLYYETAADFQGIESGAVLEDVKVGLEHLGRWERMALVSDVPWIREAVRAFGFLLPGKVRVFTLAEAPAARSWISESLEAAKTA